MDIKDRKDLNQLKKKLEEGEVCLGAIITINSPDIAEIMSQMDFDWLWIETEHSTLNLNNVQSILQATNGSNINTLIRIPWNDKTMVKRALDTGPDGIIIPLVKTRKDAENAVISMKYPPLGERGAGLSRAQTYGLKMDEYFETANDKIMTVLMIEHIEAVENISEIIRVKGIDSIIIGSLDLSGSMGLLGQTSNKKVEDAIQKVLFECKKIDMPCGILALSPKEAKKRIQEGFRNIILGIDVLYLQSAIKNTLSNVKG